MYCVEDPVFAMDESFFPDGGSRLVDVKERHWPWPVDGDLLPLRSPRFLT